MPDSWHFWTLPSQKPTDLYIVLHEMTYHMNITPISGPRTAPILGAKTVAAENLRTQAIEKFNQGLVTSGSPSQPGATLEPSQTLTQSPSVEASTEAPMVEQSASTPPPPTSIDTDLEAKRIASHYANLARKEKALRFKEAQMRARYANENRSAAPSNAPTFDASKYVAIDDLRKNTFGILNNIGLTYEELTQKALDAPSAEDLQQRRETEMLRAKVESLEKAQEQAQKTFAETQTQARRQAELQIHQDVNRLIAQDPSFEAIKAERANREVTRLITTVYDKGMGPDYPRGTILDVSDAAQMVEAHLTQRALRLARLNKVQQQLNSNTAAQKPTNTQQPATPALRTLTNSVGTSTRKLSPRERALAAFRGEAV